MLSAWANQATLRAPLSQPDPSGYFISPMKRLKTWARAALSRNSNHPGIQVVVSFLKLLHPRLVTFLWQWAIHNLMIKVCDQSNDSYRAVITCGTVYYGTVYYHMESFKWKLHMYFTLLCYPFVQTFKSVDETLVCDLSSGVSIMAGDRKNWLPARMKEECRRKFLF